MAVDRAKLDIIDDLAGLAGARVDERRRAAGFGVRLAKEPPAPSRLQPRRRLVELPLAVGVDIRNFVSGGLVARTKPFGLRRAQPGGVERNPKSRLETTAQFFISGRQRGIGADRLLNGAARLSAIETRRLRHARRGADGQKRKD